MNNQDAFNTSFRHLLKQNRKSVDQERPNYCRYRGEDGCMCAVGPLIPDELYSTEMENLVPWRLLDDFPALAEHLTGVSVQLLERLQEVHDCRPVNEWRDALIDVARRFGLEVPTDAD